MAYEQLWAPWRLQYIQDAKSQRTADGPQDDLLPGARPSCFLCRAAVSGPSREHFVAWQGEHAVVLLNRYPYNNGHLLIAPRRHRARLDQLDCPEQHELNQTITRMVQALEAILHPGGFNIGLNLGEAAGAGVPDHLHWHIVPRWDGDTNFMAVTSAVRVIPQSLEALWEALVEQLAKE